MTNLLNNFSLITQVTQVSIIFRKKERLCIVHIEHYLEPELEPHLVAVAAVPGWLLLAHLVQADHALVRAAHQHLRQPGPQAHVLVLDTSLLLPWTLLFPGGLVLIDIHTAGVCCWSSVVHASVGLPQRQPAQLRRYVGRRGGHVLDVLRSPRPPLSLAAGPATAVVTSSPAAVSLAAVVLVLVTVTIMCMVLVLVTLIINILLVDEFHHPP